MGSTKGIMAAASTPNTTPKIVTGLGGYVLEDVAHLSDYIDNLPNYPNPLQDNPAYSVVKQYFVHQDDTVPQKVVVHKDGPRGTHFRRAGPRQKVYFESDEVRACIVPCMEQWQGTLASQVVLLMADILTYPSIESSRNSTRL